MTEQKFKFKAEIWEWSGKGAWHFVSLPKDITEQIHFIFADAKRGFGSLPVMVTLGSSTWKTSIFPDKKNGSFILPMKASIRKKEGVISGDEVTVEIEVQG